MKHRLTQLDMLRGLAALAVCAGHLRGFLFVDYNATSSVVDKAFYLATGLAHQAVVVFFVLSGYLVGGSVLTAYEHNRWSWLHYALRRVSRLWVALLPALALTLALDASGRSLAPEGYAGGYHATFNSGPSPRQPTDLSAATLLKNVAFLQTLHGTPCYGTNGPLWSLANEFWYYALFPLLVAVVLERSLAVRIGCALAAIGLIVWLPSHITLSGLIWLMGVAAYVAGRETRVRAVCSHPVWLAATTAALVGTLVASKRNHVLGTDWAVGVAFTLLVVGLAATERRFAWLDSLFVGLSEMSYTLYLTHFPLMAFVFFTQFQGRQLPPGPSAYAWFLALLTLSVAYGAALWWCFERNTDVVRRWIETRFLGLAKRD